LREYSAFIAKAQAFCDEYDDLKKGLKAAIKYCREHGILKEFLEKNARKVLSMLYAEWNLEDALAVTARENREKGRKEGQKERDKYFLDLLDQGLTPEEIKQRLSQTPN